MKAEGIFSHLCECFATLPQPRVPIPLPISHNPAHRTYSPFAGRIAEDVGNCELISKEEGAIDQLVLMALSGNPLVVGQACKTIGEGGGRLAAC